jgi:hypothetical protein
MDEASRSRHDGFAALQASLARLVEAITDYIATQRRNG